MISDNNKKLAQWAMDYALKNGCQQAKVSIDSGSSSSFELRDGKMDRLQQASENGLAIYLYVDGRYGSYNTNRLNKAELETFIKNGIEATRYLAKDEARKLPNESKYYKGGKPDLQLMDKSSSSISPDDKIALAKASANEILGTDPRIISVNSSFRDGISFGYRITSNGFEGDTQRSWNSLYTGVSIKGEGEARPSAGWGESSIYFDKLVKDNLGKIALERALAKIGQKKIQSGKYTMVIEPSVSTQLLRPLISAIYGSSLQQKNSFLLNKLNEQVVASNMTLMDEPHLAQSSGARYFDGEGVATSRRAIFDKGVLNTYYIDTYNANKMGCESTIDSPSLLVMNMGDKDCKALIKDVANGILVTGFNGGNCNSTSGDFSYGIEGFLIENGILTQPISEMNVTGNMLSLWSSLSATGNDPRLTSSWRIPTLVFEEVNFSGL